MAPQRRRCVAAGRVLPRNRRLQPPVESRCLRAAEEDTGNIEKLRVRFLEIADDLPQFSTSRGQVDRFDAPVYLDQELRRDVHLNALRNWGADFRSGRERIQRLLGACEHLESVTDEERICAEAIELLGGRLSDLLPHDECLRACYILGQVRERRAAMRTEVILAPLSSTRSAVMTFASLMGPLLHGTLTALTVGETALEYAIKTGSVWERYHALRNPELRSRAIVDGHREQNPGLVIMGLSEAGMAAY